MKNRASLLVLPLLAVSALAQDTLKEEEQPDVRRYTVEMIVFSYAQNVSAGSEVFVPDLPPVEDLLPEGDELDPIPLQTRESMIEARLAQEKVIKYELVMLPQEDFELLETYEHLERLEAYQPLMHFGWTQPTYPDEEVSTRPLSFFATPPDGLAGELTLYLSRYLHLKVKLQLDAPVDGLAEDIPVRSRFDDGYYDYDLREHGPAGYPVRYLIDEDRIFRNGELRYFDHPKFGVLAKITRVKEEETEDGELLD